VRVCVCVCVCVCLCVCVCVCTRARPRTCVHTRFALSTKGSNKGGEKIHSCVTLLPLCCNTVGGRRCSILALILPLRTREDAYTVIYLLDSVCRLRWPQAVGVLQSECVHVLSVFPDTCVIPIPRFGLSFLRKAERVKLFPTLVCVCMPFIPAHPSLFVCAFVRVHLSALVEHFESFIRDRVESSVSRWASAKASSEPSRLSSFPRSDGVTAAWFPFGFGVKHSVRQSPVLSGLGMREVLFSADCGSFRK